jgi:hypothetical protein
MLILVFDAGYLFSTAFRYSTGHAPGFNPGHMVTPSLIPPALPPSAKRTYPPLDSTVTPIDTNTLLNK